MRVELLLQARRITIRCIALWKDFRSTGQTDLPLLNSLFTVLTVRPSTPINKTWLKSTLRIVLDRHDRSFGSPFAEGFLFAGASAAEAEMQQEARDIIQQRKAWKAFHSQEGCEQDFVQGPHLYYNGTIWQIMRIHDDTSGSFLTALTLYNQVHPKRVGNSSFGKKGRFWQNQCYFPDLEISWYPLTTRLWASLFPHELQGRTCGRCKGLRFAVFFFFLLFSLHVWCLEATLWAITDLSLFTYKNLARLDAP